MNYDGVWLFAHTFFFKSDCETLAMRYAQGKPIFIKVNTDRRLTTRGADTYCSVASGFYGTFGIAVGTVYANY